MRQTVNLRWPSAGGGSGDQARQLFVFGDKRLPCVNKCKIFAFLHFPELQDGHLIQDIFRTVPKRLAIETEWLAQDS